MPWIVPALVAVLANSVILSLAYLYLAWLERDKALELFFLGWALYTFRFIGMLGYVASGSTSAFWLAVDETAAISSAVVLLLAMLRFTNRRVPPWLWLVACCGLAWVGVMSYLRPAFWIASLAPYMIVGFTLIYLGVSFFAARNLPIRESRFVGVIFVLWGLHKLDYPLLRPIESFAPWGYLIGSVLGLLGALGIILVYFQLARRLFVQSQVNYYELVDSSPYPIVVHRDELLVFANQKAAQLVGLDSPAELLGGRLTEYMEITSTQPLPVKNNNMPNYKEYELTATLKHQDSRPLTLRTIGLDVTFDGGPARLVFCQDITEKKEAELQLRQAERLQALGTLAGGIAHDFNNILFAIQGFTELARSEMPTASQPHDYLDEVLVACRRAAELIKQILAFARHQDRQPHTFELAPVVKEALRLLRASLPSTISFNVQLEQQALVAQVMADPTGIHQVLMNLCTNASHAMPEGGVLTVSLVRVLLDEDQTRVITGLQPGPHLMLSVEDTGTGIPPKEIERIFEPFFTTKAPGEGTGMGLAVVHGIVTGYGGAITVQSEPGTGTRFTAYLPLVDSQMMETESAQQALLPKGCGHVLIVDDEPVLLDLLERMVRVLGYQPVRCSDGQAALNALNHGGQDYCAVVSDQTMPRLTGLELARRLAKTHPKLPVILLTGFSSALTAESLRGTHVLAVMNKPVLLGDLAFSLARACPTTAPAEAHA